MKSDVTDAFQRGDLVQLKSGGPIMTVDAPSEYSDGVFAIWFAYGKRHRSLFPPQSLQHAESPSAPTVSHQGDGADGAVTKVRSGRMRLRIGSIESMAAILDGDRRHQPRPTIHGSAP